MRLAKKSADICTPSFDEVARLIADTNPPPWVPALLEWWAQGVAHDRLAEELRPSKVEAGEILSEIAGALSLVRRGLEVPTIRNLIAATTEYSPPVEVLMASMNDLSRLITQTRSSPLLLGKDGKTKRGRGKPKLANVFSAKTLCAARILELGRFINKHETGARSIRAAKATEAFWIASGGTSRGTQDLVSGWKRHFKAARADAGATGLKRLIWKRDLEQCARRGHPPWFLGRTFPASQAS
jgi:hypothetical protein